MPNIAKSLEFRARLAQEFSPKKLRQAQRPLYLL
jgi:hypothetical protein